MAMLQQQDYIDACSLLLAAGLRFAAIFVAIHIAFEDGRHFSGIGGGFCRLRLGVGRRQGPSRESQMVSTFQSPAERHSCREHFIDSSAGQPNISEGCRVCFGDQAFPVRGDVER